jgi:hypothetical protein
MQTFPPRGKRSLSLCVVYVLSEFKGESEKLELFEAVNLAGGFQVPAWRNGYLSNISQVERVTGQSF